MANKIVTASGKGGVGKSTICKGLAMQFSASGLRTLLVDCDAGLASLDIMLGKTENVNFTWHDIILEQCEADDALLEVTENLFLLASPRYPLTEGIEDQFKKTIEIFDKKFDIIILDSPAGLGKGLQRAAIAATKGIIVATADEISVKGAASVAGILKNCGIEETRLIINRYDIKAAKKGNFLTVDEIIDKTVVQLIGIIPEDKNIVYSTVSDKQLKTKKSDKAFNRISRRISGENVELKLSQLK